MRICRWFTRIAGFGGESAQNSLRLLEAVPGSKLVFDTGNPTGQPDIPARNGDDSEGPRQSSWGFYSQVKSHIAYIHIKDGHWDAKNRAHQWVLAGDGDGQIREILADLLHDGYDGGASIEPHLPPSRHPELETGAARFQNYLDSGRRVMEIVASLK